jgi:hypothetical protein
MLEPASAAQLDIRANCKWIYPRREGSRASTSSALGVFVRQVEDDRH